MDEKEEELNWLWAKYDKAERDMRMWRKKIDEFHKRYNNKEVE